MVDSSASGSDPVAICCVYGNELSGYANFQVLTAMVFGNSVILR
jgi:hypothetical protein